VTSERGHGNCGFSPLVRRPLAQGRPTQTGEGVRAPSLLDQASRVKTAVCATGASAAADRGPGEVGGAWFLPALGT